MISTMWIHLSDISHVGKPMMPVIVGYWPGKKWHPTWYNKFNGCCLNMIIRTWVTVYPMKYAHGFCFAVLCCGYTLTDFPISIRLTSLALWQSNDCPSASKATLMNMDNVILWIHYEWLHNHNKAKHNKTVCIFLGIYCTSMALWLLYQYPNVSEVTISPMVYCISNAAQIFCAWTFSSKET